MAKRDNHLAARALAEWATKLFRKRYVDHYATKYEVASSTLWNWKKALDSDPELRANFDQRLNDLLNQDWATELDDALREAIERMRHLMLSSTDLREVTEAFKALGEVAITREVLASATDGQQDTSGATQGRPAATAAPSNLN